MATVTSTIDAAMIAFVDGMLARANIIADGVQVSSGYLGGDTAAKESIQLTDVPSAEQKWGMLGNRRRDEEYTLNGLIWVVKAGKNEAVIREARARAFALLAEIEPRQVGDWYLAMYVDAVEWVELPNTLGMALGACGGRFTSKPYIASGQYIQRMSNYCGACPYDPAQRTGDAACPVTVLYWRFLLRHEETFKAHPRMALMARSLGYPARVVMGFAPEVRDGEESVAVTGHDVTAWVEVAFEGVGWIPFSPTPDQTDVPQDENPKPKTEPQPQVRQPPRSSSEQDDLVTAVEIDDGDSDDDGLRLPGWLLLLLSVPLAVLVCCALNFSIEKIAYRPLRSAPRLSPLITAIGMSLLLQTLAMIIWKPNPKPFPTLLPPDPIDLGGPVITITQCLILGLTVVILSALMWLVNRTKLGRAMRATAENPRVAGLMGVKPDFVISATFVFWASMRTPSSSMAPVEVTRLPIKVRKRVVFPMPLRPRIAVICPLGTDRLTSCSAWLRP